MSLMTIRKIHKFAGLFFAPTILFFSMTGLIQTFDFHKARPGNQPPELVLRVAALHKDQTTHIRSRPAGPGKAKMASKVDEKESAPQAALKIFVAAASLSLIMTTILGVVLTLQPARGRGLAWVVMGLGVVVPTLAILAM